VQVVSMGCARECYRLLQLLKDEQFKHVWFEVEDGFAEPVHYFVLSGPLVEERLSPYKYCMAV
jgi:hypothetical protein